jgi:TetR/AcrR family transcriptional regulator of autoinduction and epiphytic fitness
VVASTASRTSSKRAYGSPTREHRARATRECILRSARAEFLRLGYAATTMRAVAAAAGVSVPTVELVYGTKPQLLQAAISFAIRGDPDPVPMLQRDWAARAARSRSASDFLVIVARVLVDAAQRSAGLVVAAFESAHRDESMRALSDQLRAQRTETAAWIVDGVIARAPLRPEIDRDQAIDTVWTLMDPRVFCALTDERGWAPERFELWFTDSVARLLLAAHGTMAATAPRRRGTRSSPGSPPPPPEESRS